MLQQAWGYKLAPENNAGCFDCEAAANLVRGIAKPGRVKRKQEPLKWNGVHRVSAAEINPVVEFTLHMYDWEQGFIAWKNAFFPFAFFSLCLSHSFTFSQWIAGRCCLWTKWSMLHERFINRNCQIHNYFLGTEIVWPYQINENNHWLLFLEKVVAGNKEETCTYEKEKDNINGHRCVHIVVWVVKWLICPKKKHNFHITRHWTKTPSAFTLTDRWTSFVSPILFCPCTGLWLRSHWLFPLLFEV